MFKSGFKFVLAEGGSRGCWGPGASPEWVKINLLNYSHMIHQSKENLMLINIHIINMVWKTIVQKILGMFYDVVKCKINNKYLLTCLGAHIKFMLMSLLYETMH